ncbi:hypothetical protein BH23BAC2_BH23BAC2_21960 [soil metagenome]
MFEIITIKDVKLKLGEACKFQRKAHGLSRSELAELLQLSSTTIQNIENGKNATLDNLLKVANHFGLLNSIARGIDTLTTSENNNSLY